MNSHIEYLLKKLSESKKTKCPKIISCTYNEKGKIIATKFNDYKKTHPIQGYFAKKVNRPEAIYLHAEIHALLASKSKQIFGLAVARVDKNEQPALAKPCSICQEAIKTYGIKELVYTIKLDKEKDDYEFVYIE